jgi:hypothetical protein
MDRSAEKRMTKQEVGDIICRMAKKRRIEAKTETKGDRLGQDKQALMAWLFTVMGWHPATVPDEWLERLPHPSFAAFVVRTMIGENSERWGFPLYPMTIADDEPEFRGPEWDAAVQRLWDLKARLTSEPRHTVLKALWTRWQCLRMVMSWQDSHGLPEMDWPSMPLQIETGAATLGAFLSGDVEFFKDIVRMMENEAGVNRTANWIRGIEVIEIAFDLCTPDGVNPFKEQVQESAKRSGIEVADWSSMFKDCGLDFLKYKTEPRGRKKRL